MLYAHIHRGGRYELIGLSMGQGSANMESRTVYRDVDTGKIHHRKSADFDRFMAPIGALPPVAELLARAVELRTEPKMTWAKVAAVLGVKPTWLKNNLDAAGLIARAPRRPLSVTPEKAKAAIAMREKRVRWKVIARELDVNVHSIRRAIYDGRQNVISSPEDIAQ